MPWAALLEMVDVMVENIRAAAVDGQEALNAALKCYETLREHASGPMTGFVALMYAVIFVHHAMTGENKSEPDDVVKLLMACQQALGSAAILDAEWVDDNRIGHA